MSKINSKTKKPYSFLRERPSFAKGVKKIKVGICFSLFSTECTPAKLVFNDIVMIIFIV